jgi:hexokinase
MGKMKIYVIYKVDKWDIRRVVGIANSIDEALEMIGTDEDIVFDVRMDRGSIDIYEFELGVMYSGNLVFSTTNDFDRYKVLGEE